MDYSTLMEETIALYLQGRFNDAYDLITQESVGIETIESQVLNFRYAIAARAGKLDLAKSLFIEAVEGRGFWYGKDYLMEDDDLSALRSDPDILRLIEVCAEREADAKAKSSPVMDHVPATESSPKGLWIALHGNQQNARILRSDYRQVPLRGFDLYLPQSAQIDCTDAYVWNDLNGAFRQLESQKPGWGSRETVVSGFSSGGRLAVFGCLEGLLEPETCLLFAPWLPELDAWLERYDLRRLPKINWELHVGSEDEDCLENTSRLAQALEDAGQSVRFQVHEKMGHRLPMGMDRVVDRLIGENGSKV